MITLQQFRDLTESLPGNYTLLIKDSFSGLCDAVSAKNLMEMILEKLESSDKIVVTGLATFTAFEYKDFLALCLAEDLVIENLEGEDAFVVTKSSYWSSADKYRDWR